MSALSLVCSFACLVSYIHITDTKHGVISTSAQTMEWKSLWHWKWKQIIFISSLLGLATWLIRAILTDRGGSQLFYFWKILGAMERHGKGFSHWRFCYLISGNSCTHNHTKLTTDAEFCTHVVLMRTHTHIRTHNLTIWPINLHSRQLETLLWHPFGWVLPPKGSGFSKAGN